jgi:hypothetical protein
MSCRVLALAINLLCSAAIPCLGGQAIRQEEDKLLMPPNLIGTGEYVLVGFEIAALPTIPFSATIEAENRIVNADGNTTIQRRVTKVARDSRGRTRVDTDLNPVGAPIDARLIGVHIYDAVTKIDITLFPWHKFAFSTEYEDTLPPPLLREPSTPSPPVAMKPIHLGFSQQSQPEPDIRREELGIEVFDGARVRHGRETSRFPANYGGQKDAHIVVIDYWYSQELQSFVLVKQFGPHNSVHTLTLRNVHRENPDPSAFRIPKDYNVEKILMKAPETIYLQ